MNIPAGHTVRSDGERPWRLALALLIAAAALVAALSVAACGDGSGSSPSPSPSASPADSFVGTWRMDYGDQPRWVITESAGEYTIVQGVPGDGEYVPIATLDREGRVLSGKVDAAMATPFQLRLRLKRSGDEIAFTMEGGNLTSPLRRTLVKTSGSTATPVPVP